MGRPVRRDGCACSGRRARHADVAAREGSADRRGGSDVTIMRLSLQHMGLIAAALGALSAAVRVVEPAGGDVQLMTLDPGHFHAALVQKEMYEGVAPRVDIYAPLGSDLTEHINRIVAFNTRAEHPTAWTLEVHA